jgi:FkbM family methyltransferase
LRLPGVGRKLVQEVASRTGNEHRLQALRAARSSYAEYRNQRDDAALLSVMTSVLRANSCCIDVGAHAGVMLRQMTRLAPDGRHIAFEPLADHAARLTAEFPDVEVRNVALGDRSSQAQFMRRADLALSSLETVPEGQDPETWRGPILDGAERVTVAMRRLDDQLPPDFAPALIKIDVEGAEHAVLDGARETLAKHRPVVALEHSIGATHHGYPAGGIHQILTKSGHRIFDADLQGPYTQDELARTVPDGRMWFYFAFPS